MNKLPVAARYLVISQQTRPFCKSIFENSRPINQMFKEYKLDKKLVTESNIDKINIYQCSYTTHVLFVVSRYQIIAYCILGQLYYFYVTGSKINKIQDRKQELDQILDIEKDQQIQQQLGVRISKLKDRKNKLIVTNVVSMAVSVAACWFSYRFGKIIVRSIDFVVPQQMIQINYYGLLCFKKPRLIKLQDLKQIQYSQNLNKFSIKKTHQYQYDDNGTRHILATKGTGTWIQKEVVELLQKAYQ